MSTPFSSLKFAWNWLALRYVAEGLAIYDAYGILLTQQGGTGLIS